MAHKTSKDLGLKIDNSAGTLTAITGSVNSQSIANAITILDDTGNGDTQHTTLTGLAGAPTVALNGWLNSTTTGIFHPVLQGTSTTKTMEYQSYSGRYLNGEFNMSDYQETGTPDTLQTWSANFTATGAINRTSVALV